jgi:hypothetical protein
VSKLNLMMDLANAIVFALAAIGGLAGYGLGTLLFRPKGTLQDHEERLDLVEGIARSIQRHQKADRMRQLRGAAQGTSPDSPKGDLDNLPLPEGIAPTDPRAAKNALRARVFQRKGVMQ